MEIEEPVLCRRAFVLYHWFVGRCLLGSPAAGVLPRLESYCCLKDIIEIQIKENHT